jgi:hypothetical protein
VTPSSDKEAPFDVAIQSAREGIKVGKKRHKQHPQGATTTTDYDDDNNRKAGGSDVVCITAAMHNDKRQAWPPTDHFKRLHKEAWPNHAYIIRHKLKHRDMMKSFMISRSPT